MEKTIELFDNWNKEKKFIEFYKNKIKVVKSGEIWIAKVGINIGSEISKNGEFSRPVLIVATHLGGDLVGVIPLTTKYHQKFHQFLYECENYEKFGLNERSYFILNQFKIISLKRLERKLNNIKKKNIYYPLFARENIILLGQKLHNIIFHYPKKEPINL